MTRRSHATCELLRPSARGRQSQQGIAAATDGIVVSTSFSNSNVDMLIGIFADSHDHLDNIRLAVTRFNQTGCQLVVFAGDLVSTIAVPPLRDLQCPLVGCFGDNEGNKAGLLAGLSLFGEPIQEPPLHFCAADGTRFVVVHMKAQLRAVSTDFDVAIYAHTHKPRIGRDENGRLFINPGETSGWSFGRPTVVILETETLQGDVIDLK